MSFGKQLLQARKQIGFTRRNLSEKTGISSTQIVRYENNESEPTLSAIKKLSEALNIPITTLVNQSNDGHSQLIDIIKNELKNKRLPLSIVAETIGVSKETLVRLFNTTFENLTSKQHNILVDIAEALEMKSVSNTLKSLASFKTQENQSNYYAGKQTNKVNLQISGKAPHSNTELNESLLPNEAEKLLSSIKQALITYFQEHPKDHSNKMIKIINELDLTNIKVAFKTAQDINLILIDDDTD